MVVFHQKAFTSAGVASITTCAASRSASSATISGFGTVAVVAASGEASRLRNMANLINPMIEPGC